MDSNLVRKVYLMIGRIGSGKTSWARLVAGTNFNVIRVGGDDIRSMIKKDYVFDLQLEPLVEQMVLDLALLVLVKGKDVVIDDRHLSLESRNKICKKIKETFNNMVEIVYVWIKCPDKVALSRRLQDTRGLSEFDWKFVAKKHNEEFTVPSVDENKYVSGIFEVYNE